MRTPSLSRSGKGPLLCRHHSPGGPGWDTEAEVCFSRTLHHDQDLVQQGQCFRQVPKWWKKSKSGLGNFFSGDHVDGCYANRVPILKKQPAVCCPGAQRPLGMVWMESSICILRCCPDALKSGDILCP